MVSFVFRLSSFIFHFYFGSLPPILDPLGAFWSLLLVSRRNWHLHVSSLAVSCCPLETRASSREMSVERDVQKQRPKPRRNAVRSELTGRYSTTVGSSILIVSSRQSANQELSSIAWACLGGRAVKTQNSKPKAVLFHLGICIKFAYLSMFGLCVKRLSVPSTKCSSDLALIRDGQPSSASLLPQLRFED